MYKKILSGIILTFISIFEFQFDASAADMCTLTYKQPVNGYCSGMAQTSTLSCDTTNCASNTCIIVTVGSSTWSACRCDSCKAGTYLYDYYSGQSNIVTQMCRDTVTGQLQSNAPTIYGCKRCDCGTYSAGGTATSCTSCPSNTYGGGGDSSSCKTCPTNATCNGGCTFTCNAGYYKGGDTCTQCPLADDVWTTSSLTTKARYTSSAGATSINDCYLPSGTTYYDTKGTFKFSTTCNYE